ncbi:hypothetical protein DVH24_030146, partial [Malus domestica]
EVHTLAKFQKLSKHFFSLNSNFGIGGSSAKAPHSSWAREALGFDPKTLGFNLSTVISTLKISFYTPPKCIFLSNYRNLGVPNEIFGVPITILFNLRVIDLFIKQGVKFNLNNTWLLKDE